ncbi:hypothetical protein [Winogradskyella sp.]|uniref:hypothetical protein n=1 Tax=Winogradskyella sp. TaxID=1883156 RepID=UPI0025DFE275|nr:hypothetical protein [Winogradskyella sp.]
MKRIIYVCFIAIVLSSCTTSDNNQDPEDLESNFYALTVGNEWVYKNYKYNPNTQAYDDTGVIDAVNIIGTEVIDGNTYFKFRRLTTGNEAGITFCNPNGEHFELLRDSLGYLIWENGTVKFANNDFTPRVLDAVDWGTIYEELIAIDYEITVESGTFISAYAQRYAILSNDEQSPGLDHFYYADGYGLIYDTTSFVSQEIPAVVRRLDSYNIE